MKITAYHAKYLAHQLTLRYPPDSPEKLSGTVASAQVDLNPHQVDAALFAFQSPLSQGALLADEVGLGKTIEAGLVLSQKWAERKRRILVITPSNLRKQWLQELTEKFFLPCRILETKSYNTAIRQGQFRPFEVPEIVICSYQFEAQYAPAQGELEGVIEKPDIAEVVAKTVELVTQQTIDIPRILVVPKGEVKSGFRPFELNLKTLKYPPVSNELWLQHLRTEKVDKVALTQGGVREERPENYVVSGLVDFDDVSYDDQADLLYALGTQVVQHFYSYLSVEDTEKVLRCYQKPIAQFVHAQMQQHYFEDVSDYEVKISKGFTELKPSAYTQGANEAPLDYRVAPEDKSNMARYLFGGFNRCLYPVQKFESDAERKLAVILEREAIKWFKPARGQFQLFYLVNGNDPQEYQPDFVAETDDAIYMLEPKARNQMDAPDVLAKCDVAMKWCANASDYTRQIGGKPWRYALIPHDVIAENMTLRGLAGQFGKSS